MGGGGRGKVSQSVRSLGLKLETGSIDPGSLRDELVGFHPRNICFHVSRGQSCLQTCSLRETVFPSQAGDMIRCKIRTGGQAESTNGNRDPAIHS